MQLNFLPWVIMVEQAAPAQDIFNAAVTFLLMVTWLAARFPASEQSDC